MKLNLRWIMGLNKKSIEILLDLLEIRIDTFLVQDQEDSKELNRLRKCQKELTNIFEIVTEREQAHKAFKRGQ